MYRFLLSPRWLAGAALALAAAAVMVLLGDWQLHRYHERSAINDRIDAADTVRAVPLMSLLAKPSSPSRAGTAPGKDVAWTKVDVTGRYDPAHEIQARGRTVNGDVGFEIVTPLLLTDGTAVLVDRGWIPAPDGGAEAAPTVPPAPTGQVTVVGQIHLTESRPTPVARRDGRLDTRRISVPRLARELPYPVYDAYVLLTDQTPAPDPAFTEIPIDHEDAWQNAGYTVQWWLFAGMALFAFGWQARKEAQERSGSRSGSGSGSSSGSGGGIDSEVRVGVEARSGVSGRGGASGDRVEESDRRAAAAAAVRSGDRASDADQRAASSAVASVASVVEPGDRVSDSDRRTAASSSAAEPGDRVSDSDRRAAASSSAAEPGDRVSDSDRRAAAKRAAAASRGVSTGRDSG